MVGFIPFPKTARLFREVIITEKIDGTNACIHITKDGEFLTGSRSRWITPEDDNFGFSRWANEHKDELIALGVGTHHGEWWGSGIQRGYGLLKGEKRFSLFNTSRWCLHGEQHPKIIPSADPRIQKCQEHLPPCCGLVPVLYEGIFDTEEVRNAIRFLREYGSEASPGFMQPEGVCVYHVAGNVGFKVTLDRDGERKYNSPLAVANKSRNIESGNWYHNATVGVSHCWFESSSRLLFTPIIMFIAQSTAGLQ